MPSYDAFLLVSFGGPERMEDVMPFLENVLRGRSVPEERLRAVAAHYERFSGVSPINAQNRALLEALRAEFDRHGLRLSLYWGNRNWHPLLPDTMKRMADDGISRAIAFVTSAFSSYSSCGQYLEDIAKARAAVGERAPRIDKVRAFYNHPGFIEAMSDRVRAAFEELPAGRRAAARLAFTAHSIPLAMASRCAYVAQLEEACRLVAAGAGRTEWGLAYQSRSGAPHQLWLEPDILDHLRVLRDQGATDVVVAPIGFVSDHMEVRYDLDLEARGRAEELGLNLVRAGTAGSHPRFVSMVRELVEERQRETPERPALGTRGPVPDVCPEGCCPVGSGRSA
ncbi:MAG TPA: ferrochelatase [Vicinamibacteria bacterium]